MCVIEREREKKKERERERDTVYKWKIDKICNVRKIEEENIRKKEERERERIMKQKLEKKLPAIMAGLSKQWLN